MTTAVTQADLRHLRRCVELAAEAVEAGDIPSIRARRRGSDRLVEGGTGGDGGDRRATRVALAQWAAANMAPEERAAATVYTSGEHCPCAPPPTAGSGWGVSRATVAAAGRLARRAEVSPAPVLPLAITEVVPGLVVAGPVPELADGCATCTVFRSGMLYGGAAREPGASVAL
jgi:hypothetical protein